MEIRLTLIFLVLALIFLAGCSSTNPSKTSDATSHPSPITLLNASTSPTVASPTNPSFTSSATSPLPGTTPRQKLIESTPTPQQTKPLPEITATPITPSPTYQPTHAPEARQTALARLDRYCLLNRQNGGEAYALDYYAFYPEPSPQFLSLFVVSVHPSCNYPYNRVNEPRAIVLHYTLGSWSGALSSWRAGYENPGTSAHYIVTKSGEIIQIIPENRAANHVVMEYDTPDTCKFPPLCSGDGPVQEHSIGIEIENYGPLVRTETGFTSKYGQPIDYQPFHYNEFGAKGDPYVYEWWDPYTPEQLRALHYLIWDIAERWQIDIPDMIVGHSQIQSRIDPGPALEKFLQDQLPISPDEYYRQDP